MKSKWLYSLFASVPVIAAVLSLQSCAGVGGPLTDTGGGGLPSASEAFLALMTDVQKTAAYIGSDACADPACHGGRDSDPVYTHWKDTEHAAKGVGCERCHGPGGAHRAAPSKDNILTLPKTGSDVVCGQCHGATHAEYGYSGHTKIEVHPVEDGITNPNTYGRTSRCMACHSSLYRTELYDRGIDPLTVSDDKIKEIAEGTLLYSPHSAVCITCHNPHAKTGNLDVDGNERQLRHKIFNTDTVPIGPGTTAASFTTYDHLCGQCHNGRGTDPADAKLQTGTTRPSMHDSNQMQMLMGFGGVDGPGAVQSNTAHANAPGQCVKCHMPDSKHTFVVNYEKGCSPCHSATDAASRVNATKTEVLSQMTALRVRLNAWAFATYGDEIMWEYTSNITAEGKTPPTQSGVPIEIKRARHNYYFVVRSGDYGVHNAPYAKHLITVANQNLDALGAAKPIMSKMPVSEMQKVIEADKARASKAELDEIK